MLGLLCQDIHVSGEVPAGPALLYQYSQPRSVNIQTVAVLAHKLPRLSNRISCCL